MNRKALVLLVAAALLVPVAASGSADAVDYAQFDDISVSPSVEYLTVDAGGSAVVYIDVHNKLSYSTAEPNTLPVYIYFVDTDGLTVSFTNGHQVVVNGQGTGTCEILIEVGEYASGGEYKLSFTVSINDPNRGSPITREYTGLITLAVESELSSSGTYNKILGVWDNNLPGVLGTPLATTVLSLLVWIAAAALIAFYVLPLALRWFEDVKRRVEERIRRSKEDESR